MDIIFYIISALGAIYGCWFLAIIVIGLLKKQQKAENKNQRRFALLIPARNEEKVIPSLIFSLRNLDYPKELYDVYALINNCTDSTEAAAKKAGAKIINITKPVRSKGEVLSFAFEYLKNESYDGYCIFDADNLVNRAFLTEINAEIDAGADVVQAYRDSKNPSDGWVAGGMSIFFWLMSRLFNRSRRALGLNALLSGTGIAISKETIEKYGYNVSTLTEDQEYTAICALNGTKIGYAEKAVIYDEQTDSLITSIIQRRRWFSGTRQCFLRYAFPLLKKHSPSAIDIFFVYTGVIMQLTGLFCGLYTIVNTLTDLINGTTDLLSVCALLVIMLSGAYILCVSFALWLCYLEKKLTKKRAGAILLFPLFLVSWFIANVWALFTPDPAWKQIAHTKAVSAPEK